MQRLNCYFETEYNMLDSLAKTLIRPETEQESSPHPHIPRPVSQMESQPGETTSTVPAKTHASGPVATTGSWSIDIDRFGSDVGMFNGVQIASRGRGLAQTTSSNRITHDQVVLGGRKLRPEVSQKGSLAEGQRSFAAPPMGVKNTQPGVNPVVPHAMCSKCGFHHDGDKCMTYCKACSVTKPGEHRPQCVYCLYGKRGSQPIVEKRLANDQLLQSGENQFKASPIGPDKRVLEGAIVPTMRPSAERLSRVCQQRGFNPFIRVFGSANRKRNRAEVAFGELKAHVFICDGVFPNFPSAREAAIKQALEYLQENPEFRPIGGPRYLGLIRPPPGHWYPVGGKPSKMNLATGTEANAVAVNGFATLQLQNTAGSRVASSSLVKATPRTQKIDRYIPIPGQTAMTTSHTGQPTGSSVARKPVNLPGDVHPKAVEGIVKEALVSAYPGISFNLPGNVTADVAEAYGKAFFAGIDPGRRRHRSRSRTRSRSPQQQPRADRDHRVRDDHRAKDDRRDEDDRRVRDREYRRDRESKSSYWH